jgi:hypothetical protein
MWKKNCVVLCLAIMLISSVLSMSASAQGGKVVSSKAVIDVSRFRDFVSHVDVYSEKENLEFTEAEKRVSLTFEAYNGMGERIPIDERLEFLTIVDSSSPERYKWGYFFILPDVDFIPKLSIVSENGLRVLDDMYIIVGSDKFMSFEDVIAEGFDVRVEQVNENIALVTLRKDWSAEGFKAGDKIAIDPYLMPMPWDGQLGRDRLGNYEVVLTGTAIQVGNDVGVGDNDWFYRGYYKFNTSMIDPWDTVINATFYARVSGKTCGSGSSRFWLQNISDFGDLGESDWGIPYQNISIYFYANENTTGWYSVNVSNWVVKAGMTYYRLMGSYENYDGVDCFINVNSNESAYEPYVEVYWTDGSPSAPNITVHSPLNASYATDVIPLQVSAYGGGIVSIDKWWYSLNGGSNATFIPNSTIYASLGSNCVTVYLNNTYGSQSSNTTCFTVSSFGTALDCWVVPTEIPVGQTLIDYCNFTYAQNSSAIDNAFCAISLVDPIVLKRFYGMDSEEQLSNDNLGGFSVQLTTDMYDIGGGAYLRCTNQTTGNFSIWAVISSANPFTSLDGVRNITSVNYTDFIGTYSCDYLDAIFGVKGSVLKPITLYGNQSWIQQSLVKLGNPSMAYYGFYGGCLNCSGGNDSWHIGTNSHNFGYTYHGNLSQQDDWVAVGNEHAQWLFASVVRAPMAFNASSGLYEQSHAVSMWAEAKQYTAFGNCSKSSFENKTSYFNYNLTGISLPVCSIDSYISIVAQGANQTFAWSLSSMTSLIDKYAVLMNSTGDILLDACSAGTYSYLMNDTGSYSIMCYVRNVVGNFSSFVPFTVAVVEYRLYLDYPPYASVGSPATIKAYLMLNGSSVQAIPNLTIFIDGSEGDMVWVPADSAYEVVWIPSANGDYPFNVSGDFPPVLVENGLIRVRTPFTITVRLWNSINMTPESRYENEFAWVYLTRELSPTLKRLFGRDKFACPPQGSDECYWHGEYVNGSATITLYEAGNYSMYIIGNNINWKQYNPAGEVVPCDFCPPWIVQSRFRLNLGDYYLSESEDFDLFYSQAELYVFGGIFGVFASWLSLAFFAGIGLLFFIFVLIATGSLKSALAGLILAPSIIYIILGLTLW